MTLGTKYKVSFRVDWNYPENPVFGYIEAPDRETAIQGMRAVLSQVYLEPEASFGNPKAWKVSDDDLRQVREYRFPEYEGRVWL